jgi:hypothetical protein
MEHMLYPFLLRMIKVPHYAVIGGVDDEGRLSVASCRRRRRRRRRRRNVFDAVYSVVDRRHFLSCIHIEYISDAECRLNA